MLKLDFCFKIFFNNNHAVLFKLADAQIVIQPASESAADYSKEKALWFQND